MILINKRRNRFTKRGREAIAAANRQRVVTPESRAKMRATKLGRKYSAAHCAAISAGVTAQQGRKQ